MQQAGLAGTFGIGLQAKVLQLNGWRRGRRRAVGRAWLGRNRPGRSKRPGHFHRRLCGLSREDVASDAGVGDGFADEHGLHVQCGIECAGSGDWAGCALGVGSGRCARRGGRYRCGRGRSRTSSGEDLLVDVAAGTKRKHAEDDGGDGLTAIAGAEVHRWPPEVEAVAATGAAAFSAPAGGGPPRR